MLKGKTAVITGGSRGIGAAIAGKFAELGANVAIIDYGNPDVANETKKSLEAMGVKAYRITKKEEVEPVLREAIASNVPVMIECIIESDDKVFPMVAPGKGLEDCFDESDLSKE